MLSPVRPSVCPSHRWISRKRLKLGSCNFHCTVASSLYFCRISFIQKFGREPPERGRQTRVGTVACVISNSWRFHSLEGALVVRLRYGVCAYYSAELTWSAKMLHYYFIRKRERSIVISWYTVSAVKFIPAGKYIIPAVSSRRQMTGSWPNLHTMVPRRVYIHGMLKFKVEMQGHVIPAHLEFHKKSLTQSFPAFALPNSGCLCRTYGTSFVPQFPYMLAILGSEKWHD